MRRKNDRVHARMEKLRRTPVFCVPESMTVTEIKWSGNNWICIRCVHRKLNQKGNGTRDDKNQG